MQLRIIGGRLRGKKLQSVPGVLTRPTASRVRESVFNILSFDVRDKQVLDLFAGTGILGLEALSRGAASVVFVDNDRRPLSVIQKNVSSCNVDADVRVVKFDLSREWSPKMPAGDGFQLVFMDPPYNQNLVGPTLVRLSSGGLLEKGAIVTVEHSPLEPILTQDTDFVLEDQRKYGKTQVSFLIYSV